MSICVFHGLYILFFQLIMFHLFWTSFLYIYMYVLIWFIYTYLSHIYIYLFCAVSFALSKMFILKLFRRKIWCNENKYKWIQCSSIYVSRNYISLERIFFVKGKHFFCEYEHSRCSSCSSKLLLQAVSLALFLNKIL